MIFHGHVSLRVNSPRILELLEATPFQEIQHGAFLTWKTFLSYGWAGTSRFFASFARSTRGKLRKKWRNARQRFAKTIPKLLNYRSLKPNIEYETELQTASFHEKMTHPKNSWDVCRGVKLPPVLKPFFGVSLGGHKRCLHKAETWQVLCCYVSFLGSAFLSRKMWGPFFSYLFLLNMVMSHSLVFQSYRNAEV